MGPYCKFCDSRCFIPADLDDRKVPKQFHKKFVDSGCPILATCHAGKAFDKKALGFNVDDLVWLTKVEGK